MYSHTKFEYHKILCYYTSLQRRCGEDSSLVICGHVVKFRVIWWSILALTQEYYTPNMYSLFCIDQKLHARLKDRQKKNPDIADRHKTLHPSQSFNPVGKKTTALPRPPPACTYTPNGLSPYFCLFNVFTCKSDNKNLCGTSPFHEIGIKRAVPFNNCFQRIQWIPVNILLTCVFFNCPPC